MFGNLFDSIARFFQQFVFWYVVEPWEQCLRVRAGKHVLRKKPGFHWRVPYLDSIHTQSSRYRTSLCAPQTLTTADGHTVVCTFAIGYALDDIEKLYQTLYDANSTITQTVASFVADEISHTKRADLSAVNTSTVLTNLLNTEFCKYGLKDVTVRLQDFAFIKAFRLIQDQRWGGDPGVTTGGMAR